MIPSALSGQLQQGLADFLRFSFWSSTPGMEQVVDDLLEEAGGLTKGPYVSLKLPFESGTKPDYFPDVPLGFMPHLHQEQAFARLGGRRKQSTLVATGTGSGKTESFLLPVLDHCLSEAGTPGVKAILIYPMNALATDQAGRIARMVHGNDKLRGKVRAGLYIGDDAGSKSKSGTQMGPDAIITDRAEMQRNPPDILLTNYKMLDYLLLRPRDQGIWQHNLRGTLRFLVVDEIHTFDGAQGTDLACLIRRLKRRLQVDDGALCCVGTSATLGGDEARQQLLGYAAAVFGELFDDEAVIGETRLSEEAYLAGIEREWTEEPGPEDRAALDPAQWTEPEDWLRAQVALWFGELHEGEGPAWSVALGERLQRHAAFQALLAALGGETVGLGRLMDRMARGRSDWRRDPAFGRLVLGSLIGLVSAARAWRAELLEVAAAREEAGEPRPIQPFLDVRVQLWQRELRRMVGSMAERPRLRHSMDLDRETLRRHLPMVHCRECGAMGWATVIDHDKPHLMSTQLDRFYRAFFSGDPRVAFLYPAASVTEPGKSWYPKPFAIDVETMSRIRADDRPDGPVVQVHRAANTRSTAEGQELTRDCPFCAARESLTLIGFRAATLTSVYVDQLFASPFNDDKKLLTFSDSVQDAAHRAGFFGARTWRTNLRIAMLQVIRQNEGITLRELGRALGATWRERMGDPAAWVASFLAPNMAWLHDWETLKQDGKLPPDSDLDELIDRRLAFEVGAEFGLQSGIGRSLPRTGAAAVALDPERLDRAVEASLEPMRNEVPGLRDLQVEELRTFLLGLLHHLRMRGGVLPGELPEGYIETLGKDVHSFKRSIALPAFGRSSRLPELLTDDKRASRFVSWSRKADGSWYDRWLMTSLGRTRALTANPADAYPHVLQWLVAVGLLEQRIGRKDASVWGVSAEALRVMGEVGRVRCARCGNTLHVAQEELGRWPGTPCLTARCSGAYEVDDGLREDYFGRLYAGGDLRRIFTEEHTGLLTRADRERVEREFKASDGAPSDPDARKPWYANLLSCTPTLEMGVDIGDLSTAILCSMPPTQANYLQRIGRAGRRDGNAFLLTVALARPHDLYFFAQPSEMFAGEVAPPGVFLDAPTVLERQLTAFCFDRWVAKLGDQAELPHALGTVFGRLDEEDSSHFPHSFLAFVEAQQPTLLREFGEMFEGEIGSETSGHLRRHLLGGEGDAPSIGWKLIDALSRERQQRDSLSSKARAVSKEIKQLETREAKSKDHEEEIGQLEQEKAALQALVRAVNKRQTLEFLTGEGLLPNYAFPEAAVSLKSVIWRKKKNAPAAGGKYETWTHEYQRSPASALSELAPEADFYAGGRKVRIDQVDVTVSKPESWRFCTDCSHAQRIDTGDEASNCPACDSANWKDDGQRFRLLRLQQVFARAPDRESRIRDDQDDRQPRFFQRQMLVGIQDEHRGAAFRIDDPSLPFGFEYLKHATFRDVNFGEPNDQGAKSTIAGQEGVRQGFRLCARCGKVQNPRQETPEHALSCPSRKPGAKQEMEDCLYLYREFQSEALRMLLPLTDMLGTRELHSFIAALQLGLKERFGGSVDHLRTTLYSDPAKDTSLRKQYLVLYDMVPGGTGYLKQLVTAAAEGARIPLFDVLEQALQRIEGCVCWSDPERDGCYRCLYGYRNARDMDDTSARTASQLLRQLLEREPKLIPIESLGDVSIVGLMDSILEARFIEALREITDAKGRPATVKAAVLNGKAGFRWSLGDAEWHIEPQVEPPKAETGGIPVSIDFVMRPAHSGDDRKLAIFLDGWAYHRDRVGKDLRQRMALQASGNWQPWTFTWQDLDEKFGFASAETLELAVPDPAALKSTLQGMGLPKIASLGYDTTFEWFEAELQGTGLPWDRIGLAALAARMTQANMQDGDRWRAFVGSAAPPVVHDELRAMSPRLVAVDAGEINEHVHMMALHDGDAPALVCVLDDRTELHDQPEYKAAWGGFLRLFQLLRALPNAWFMTRSGLAEAEAYAPIAHLRGAVVDGMGWAELDEIEPKYQALARALMDAGIPEPVVGDEVPDANDEVWALAELIWEEKQVAITSREMAAEARREPAAGWTVLYLEDLADGIGPVVDALD